MTITRRCIFGVASGAAAIIAAPKIAQGDTQIDEFARRLPSGLDLDKRREIIRGVIKLFQEWKFGGRKVRDGKLLSIITPPVQDVLIFDGEIVTGMNSLMTGDPIRERCHFWITGLEWMQNGPDTTQLLRCIAHHFGYYGQPIGKRET